MGAEAECEVTYIPRQTVFQVVHVEQSQGDHQFELVVDLNNVVHSQQLLTADREEKSHTEHQSVQRMWSIQTLQHHGMCTFLDKCLTFADTPRSHTALERIAHLWRE